MICLDHIQCLSRNIYPRAIYKALDYYTEAGGVVEVEFIFNNDGDTAYFTPGFEDNDRVRFIGIDTLETGSGDLATNARLYVKGLLRKCNSCIYST